MLAVLGMAVFASFVKFWPYNLSLTLKHYTYGLRGRGRRATRTVNSLDAGCVVRGARRGRSSSPAPTGWRRRAERMRCGRSIRFQAMLPMAVPGMVLGLGYIFFFNAPANPLNVPVRHDGDPGALDDRPLLLVEPPDGGHRAEAARRRVRVGVGVAEGAVLQDVLARHRAGVPAGDPRHRPLLISSTR